MAEALRLFPPQGALHSAERARALLAAALLRLSNAAWSKVRRSLQRPQVLAFLDTMQQRIAALSLPAEVVEAAVRGEGLRRRPKQLGGKGASGALRARWGLFLGAAGLVAFVVLAYAHPCKRFCGTAPACHRLGCAWTGREVLPRR